VPFSAGGALDVLGRILAERMRSSLGQTIVIENVTGASGSLGVGRVARAAPDGCTLVIGYWGTHVANGAVYALPYDVVSNFEPIALTVTNANLIVSKNAAPAKNLRELIGWLKANPDKAAGTTGIGSIEHVGGILFQNITGTRFHFVPYRGAAPAVQDLVAGQIDLIVENLVPSLPQIREGNIKAFAVTAKTRLAAAPEIPTVDEAGLPGFYVTAWLGLWAPKGTSQNAIAKLNSATVTALANPTVRMRLADLGFACVMFRNGTGGFNGMVRAGCTKKPFMPSISRASFVVTREKRITRPLLRSPGWLAPIGGKLRSSSSGTRTLGC